jgi:phosphoribosylglycinamide formyltransferase-1
MKVNLVLIASGSGTDAAAIIKAYSQGLIPNVKIKLLISTKGGAGCLEKAREFNIRTKVIDRQSLGQKMFEENLKFFLFQESANLVFLVGCIVKMPLIPGIVFKNIHPADTVLAGGKRMYGLEPHKKVLAIIKEQIDTGIASKDDVFYTHPTVHNVEEAYDTGQPLLRLSLKIPKIIINSLGNEDSDTCAAALQAYVLPYEWMLLPLAVKIAAQQMLDDEGQNA